MNNFTLKIFAVLLCCFSSAEMLAQCTAGGGPVCYVNSALTPIGAEICPDPGMQVQITFTQGQVENSWDELEVYSGAMGSGSGGTEVYNGYGSGGDLTGLVVEGATDECISVFVDGDSSNDCVDQGYTPIVFTSMCITPPSCPDPTSVTATDITETTADIGWTTGGSATSATVWVCPTGVAPPDASCISVSSAGNPETVTGLTGTTDYDAFVQEICGGDMSAVVGPTAFTTLAAAPANDDCGGAIALTVNADLACGSVTNGTIAGATASPEDVVACFGTEDDDVWFTFVATATSHEIDLLNITGGTTDLYHSLWEGACGSLTHQGLCSDPNSSTATGLTIGATYHLRVYSWTSTAGQTSVFDVCIGTLPPPPANDACAGAMAVVAGAATASGSTASATNVEGLTACSGNTSPCATAAGGTGFMDFGAGVWFVYTSPSAEEFTVDTDGSSFDTEIQVFTGTCGALTCVAGDDDSGVTGSNSLVCITSAATRGVAAVDYYIYVDGHGTNTGDFILNITAAPLPVELISFEGKTEKSSNMLMWKTATEENTEKHVIERSLDGRSDWEFVGEKAAAGFTTETQSYMLEDTKPLAKAYYRLRSIDFDGYEDVSNIVYLERKTDRFDIIGVYPVPTKARLTIDFETLRDQEVEIRMTDMLGKAISRSVFAATAGINTEIVDMSNLSSGVYFVTIYNGTESITKRVIKN